MRDVVMSGRVMATPLYYPERVGAKSLALIYLVDQNVKVTCRAYGFLADRLNRQAYKGVKLLVDGILDNYKEDSLVVTIKNFEVIAHTQEYLQKYGSTKTEAPKNELGLEEDENGFIKVDPDGSDLPF